MVQAGRIGPNAADLIKMQVGDVFKGRQAAEPNPPMMTVPGFEKKPVYKTVYDFDAMQAALAQMEDFILPQVDKKPRPLPETPAKTPTEKIVKEAAVTHDALERYLERHAANLTRLDEQRRAQWASVGQDIQREFEESTLNQSQLIEPISSGASNWCAIITITKLPKRKTTANELLNSKTKSRAHRSDQPEAQASLGSDFPRHATNRPGRHGGILTRPGAHLGRYQSVERGRRGRLPEFRGPLAPNALGDDIATPHRRRFEIRHFRNLPGRRRLFIPQGSRWGRHF